MPKKMWSFDERFDEWERAGVIQPPFTPDERALARAVAEAWYFADNLTEMPARCSDGSQTLLSIDMGIMRVKQKREGRLPLDQRQRSTHG
jgi:hypothetical protein